MWTWYVVLVTLLDLAGVIGCRIVAASEMMHSRKPLSLRNG